MELARHLLMLVRPAARIRDANTEELSRRYQLCSTACLISYATWNDTAQDLFINWLRARPTANWLDRLAGYLSDKCNYCPLGDWRVWCSWKGKVRKTYQGKDYATR